MLRITDLFIDNQSTSSFCPAVYSASDTPLIAWAASSEIPASAQSEYNITVEQNGETLWKTGWVSDGRQSVYYDGAPLKRGCVKVAVMIRSDKGEESGVYSGSFVFARVTDWNADWIEASEDMPRKAIYFRKRVCIDREVKSVSSYVCGLGYAMLYINGGCLTDGVMSPSHSNYKKTAYYAINASNPEIDGSLHIGENEILIIIGDGWRRSESNFIRANTANRQIEFFGKPVLSAIIEIEYADGGVERICTGSDWSWSWGNITVNDLYDGTTYDATVEDEPEKPVSIAECPCENLLPDIIQPIRGKEFYAARTVFSPKEGVYVFDFGQNIAGVPIIKIPQGLEFGHKLSFTCHEMLDDDGSLYLATLREAKCTDTYIASGKETDGCVFRPEFTYHGFRYVQVEGWVGVPPLDAVSAIAVYTDIKSRGFFECGSALLNKIQQNVVATEKSNIHSILTDCPQRDERMGWLNDATVRFTETPYNFDIGRLFPKVLRDIRDGQREDGSIQCTAPYVFGGNPADPVCSSYLVAGVEAYRQTGDITVIRDGYDGWAAWENKLLSCRDEDEPYLVNYSYYGDWASPAYACIGEDGANSAVTPGVFMSSGFSYYNCTLLAFFADKLGKKDEAAKWHDTAENIRAAIIKKWWNPENAKMATGSQACQAFSLWLGIAPDPERAAKVMRDDLVNGGYRLTTGNLCTLYMLETLTMYGYVDEAYELMTSEEYPSYGYMIQNEATTVWERFELKKNPGMNSHNHPMYGSVGRWFYSGLCGLTVSASDSSHAVINLPKLPAKLLSAQCAVDTRFGQLAVRWAKRFGESYLYLTVPFGMTVNVRFGENVKAEYKSGWHTVKM